MSSPIRIFIAYSHQDEVLRDKLESHLAILKRVDNAVVYYDRQIVGGRDWRSELDGHLLESEIVLLLITSDFLASDYCFGVEMQTALQLHEQGNCIAIPVILRPCEWQQYRPLSRLQALPKDGHPVTLWPDDDQAFLDVARGIRQAMEELRPKPIPIHLISRWSPSALVIARLMRIRDGWYPRPRQAVILVTPDQVTMFVSHVVAIYVTDKNGDPAGGIPFALSVKGGRFDTEIGVPEPADSREAACVTNEFGYAIAKLWPEEPVVTVGVSVADYGDFSSTFFASPIGRNGEVTRPPDYSE